MIKMDNAPYIRTKNSSLLMFINILISLLPLFIYKIYLYKINFITNFILISFYTIAFLAIYNYLKKKNTYHSYLGGIVLGLLMPINTSYLLILITATIFLILEILFDKLKYFYINPALLAFLIILIFNKHNLVFDINILYIGLFTFFYLLFMKVNKWVIGISYLSATLIMSLFISYYLNINMLSFLKYIYAGYLVLSIFYISFDLKHTPISKQGSIIYGIILGVVTILLKLIFNLNDSSIYASLLVSIFIPVFDTLGYKSKLNKNKLFLYIAICWIFLTLASVLLVFLHNVNIVKISI